jgi:hypothetical protein
MISVEGFLQLPELATIDLVDPLSEYVSIRRQHSQVLNLIAVLDGLKPCMDDWIPVAAWERFTAMCDRYGLYVKAGVQFDMMTHDEVESVSGRGTLTTTRARARAIGDARGSVHVFVGRDSETVDQTFYSGWYPLVVDGRATSKPWIDHIWFGRGLGYPGCCLEAFARNNNWSVNNMPYQALRSTTGAPNALCNSIMRFTGLSWAPHLPCSYDCEATAQQSAQLREATAAVSPALVEIADALTVGTFLLLSEWEAFLFHGVHHDGNRIRYDAVSLVPSNKPNNALFEALKSGDHVELRDDLVVVMRGHDTLWVERCRTDGFAPRVPKFVEFAPIT